MNVNECAVCDGNRFFDGKYCCPIEYYSRNGTCVSATPTQFSLCDQLSFGECLRCGDGYYIA